MNNQKTVAIVRESALKQYGFIFSLGIVLLAPLLLTQSITGPVVNMALFFTAYIYGLKKESLIVAAVPSTIALLRGQLPLPLAPMVPFIIAGNIILMYVFIASFKKTGRFLPSVVVASFIKFFLLYFVSQTLIVLFASRLFVKFSVMMSWPQLFTALIGGFIAYVLIMSYDYYHKAG
jgi:hypothetical protein